MIEIIIFKLYKQYKDYFNIPQDYFPSDNDFEEFKKLINKNSCLDKYKIKKDLELLKEKMNNKVKDIYPVKKI